LFSRSFFQKSLSLCMVNIQKQVMMARVRHIYSALIEMFLDENL
jgi:hypothetical protein